MKYFLLILLLAPLSKNQKTESNPSTIYSNDHSIELREDQDYPISGISDASISPDGKCLLVSDRYAGQAFVYALRDGSIIKILKTVPSFSDSLALKGVWPQSHLKYLPTSISPPKLVQNRISSCLFINDSEIIASSVLCANLGKKDEINSGISTFTGQHPSFIKFNINTNNVLVDPTEWKIDKYAPQSDCIGIDQQFHNLFLNTIIQNNGALGRGHLDSSMCLSKFNTYGHLIEYLPYLMPKECIQYYLTPSMLNPKFTYDSKAGIVLGFDIISRIYNLSSGLSFDLSHLDAKNDSFYFAYNEFVHTHKKGTTIPWDSLFTMKPYWFINVNLDSKSNYYVTSLIRTSLNPWMTKYVVQKYSPTGQYLSSFTFKNDAHSQYKYAFYSHEIDRLVVIELMDKKNWKVSFSEVK